MNTFYYSSSSVGSGKTRRALKYMNTYLAENVLYVVPTKKLADQVKDEIAEFAPTRLSRTKVIHMDSKDHHLSTQDQALRTINIHSPNLSHVVIITTNTFMKILQEIKHPEYWILIMDEAFQPANFTEFQSKDNSGLVEQLFSIDKKTGRVAAKRGQMVKLDAVYKKRNFDGAHELNQPSLLAFIDAAMNKAINLHLYEKSLQSGASWFGYWYVTPEHFQKFKLSIYLSALFEISILKLIWEHAFKIKWVEHPYWSDISDLTHKLHGSKIKIGHLLHENDNASKLTLNNEIDGDKVINHLLAITDEYFTEDYLLSVNNGIKVSAKKATKIPPMSYGMNKWKHIHNVAALAVTNPPPELLRLVMMLTDSKKYHESDIRASFRRSTIYQNIGRCSLRDRNSKADRYLVVASKADARYLHKLFEGSQFLGQIGGLEQVTKTRKYPESWTKADIRAWQRWPKTKKYVTNLSQSDWYSIKRAKN